VDGGRGDVELIRNACEGPTFGVQHGGFLNLFGGQAIQAKPYAGFPQMRGNGMTMDLMASCKLVHGRTLRILLDQACDTFLGQSGLQLNGRLASWPDPGVLIQGV
jgi:hypothetical protein